MNNIEEYIQAQLFKLKDIKYKNFHSKLVPTVNSSAIIGVRVPELRKLAKILSNDPDIYQFLKALPHKYYEENNLHLLLIEIMNDYEQLIKELELFLPYIDNWATCDLFSPKIFKNHLPELYEHIKLWTTSEYPFTVRLSIGMLIKFYLDKYFSQEHLELVKNIKSNEYYVNMMIAWYLATALAKQYDNTLPYIQNRQFNKWVHNKALQKALESYRITNERKEYLRTLKIR